MIKKFISFFITGVIALSSVGAYAETDVIKQIQDVGWISLFFSPIYK